MAVSCGVAELWTKLIKPLVDTVRIAKVLDEQGHEGATHVINLGEGDLVFF